MGALEHRAHEVREVVLRIIFAMYREHRAAVLEFLPLDDASACRTVRYKTLFEGFAKIDGKSETEVRVCDERQDVQGHYRCGVWMSAVLISWLDWTVHG